MSANDRHAMLSSLAESCDALPIDDAELPIVSDHRLTIARTENDEQMGAAQLAHAEIESSLEAARGEAEKIAVECEAARIDLAAAREQQAALATAADEARDAATNCDEEQAALIQRLDGARRLSDAVDEVYQRLDAAASALVGKWVAPETARGAAPELEEIAAELSDIGLDGSGILKWSGSLSEGTAALDPRAVELLGSLEQAARVWTDCGADDPFTDPLVAAARERLDAARLNATEVESQARGGALGQQTKRAIEQASARRTEIESQARPDPSELADAIEAETSALQQVGFDSMLDFRIVMSTGGSGALVDNQRTLVAQRVQAAEIEMEQALTDCRARREAARTRIEQLDAAVTELVGADRPDDCDEALRGLLAPPDCLGAIGEQLHVTFQASEEDAEAARSEVEDLSSRQLDLRLARAEALAGAVGLLEQIEDGERLVADRSEQLVVAEATADELQDRLEQSAAALDALRASATELADRRYLTEDVHELRDELVLLLSGHAERVAASDPGPHALILDDPFAVLDIDDALGVLDDLLAAGWTVPVIVVTSSRPLLNRAKRHGDVAENGVHCIDPRRRTTGRRPWRRRRAAQALADD